MGIFDYFRKFLKKANKVSDSKNNTLDNLQEYDSMIGDIVQPLYEEDELIRVYKENVRNGKFVIPNDIKYIGMFAFEKLKELTSVVVNSELRYIGPYAFQDCYNLVEIAGLENAKNMKSIQGFIGCCKLSKIKLPDSTQLIADGAFYNCKSLTQINLPDGCWSIGNHSFAGCENLQEIIIPSSMEIISTNAFKGCKNLTITFLEDDKQFLDDFIKEQEKSSGELQDAEDYEEACEQEKSKLSDLEMQQVFDDLNIKHKTIDINGNKILWTPGRVVIQNDALSDVKEVVAYNVETLQRVIKSGYRGKITHIDTINNQKISIDLKNIVSNEKASGVEREFDE